MTLSPIAQHTSKLRHLVYTF